MWWEQVKRWLRGGEGLDRILAARDMMNVFHGALSWTAVMLGVFFLSRMYLNYVLVVKYPKMLDWPGLDLVDSSLERLAWVMLATCLVLAVFVLAFMFITARRFKGFFYAGVHTLLAILFTPLLGLGVLGFPVVIQNDVRGWFGEDVVEGSAAPVEMSAVVPASGGRRRRFVGLLPTLGSFACAGVFLLPICCHSIGGLTFDFLGTMTMTMLAPALGVGLGMMGRRTAGSAWTRHAATVGIVANVAMVLFVMAAFRD